MDGPLRFGDPALLQFDLRWETKEPRGTAAEATRGRLFACVRARTVWGATAEAPEGFVWTWVELLEHLARHWAYIFIEEGDPLGLDVPPERLRAKAEERWSGMPEEHKATEEELLWTYLQSHDLAAALQGVYPASLWLSREGNCLRVSCKGAVVRISIDQARATLAALGNAIAARLEALGDEARACMAVDAWKKRETIEPTRLAAIATGLEQDAVASLSDVTPLRVETLAFDQVFRPDEYLAVARMAKGALPIEELGSLFAKLQGLPEVWTGPIDSLSQGVAELLSALGDKRAFEQGYAVARWLRERLSLREEDRADPEGMLAEWKVPVVNVELSSRELDAISIWGPKHGPAVIVNRRGRHGRMNGRRATLAHEIGHLLMDRREALPVAEVMGGRVSSRVEMRARAFAAELLLPESVAGNAIMSATSRDELEQIVRRLSAWYQASLEIVAWQAANAHDRQLPTMIATYLRSLVSNPQAF